MGTQLIKRACTPAKCMCIYTCMWSLGGLQAKNDCFTHIGIDMHGQCDDLTFICMKCFMIKMCARTMLNKENSKNNFAKYALFPIQ